MLEFLTCTTVHKTAYSTPMCSQPVPIITNLWPVLPHLHYHLFPLSFLYYLDQILDIMSCHM